MRRDCGLVASLTLRIRDSSGSCRLRGGVEKWLGVVSESAASETQNNQSDVPASATSLGPASSNPAEVWPLDRWGRRLKWAESIVGILTLGAVVWYAAIAHKQWIELKATNDLTRAAQKQTSDAIAADSRAWLGVQGIDVVQFGVGSSLVLSVKVVNTGKTPALGMTSIGDVVLVDRISKGRAPIISPIAGPSMVLPNMVIGLRNERKEPLSKEEVDAIFARRLFVRVTAEMTYTDRFGGTHHTIYCGHAVGNPFGKIELIQCDGGNFAD